MCLLVSATGGGRQIVYLPVCTLNGLEQFKNSPWIRHASVRRAVLELGGHPRGLQQLREILQSGFSDSSLPPPQRELFDALLQKHEHLKKVVISPELIAMCLLGRRFVQSWCPNDEIAHTHAYYIAQVR